VGKLNDEQARLQAAIKEKDAESELATAELQELKNQTSYRQSEIRKFKEDYIHETTVKGELNR